MKNSRQAKIIEIIEKYEIGTQDALIEKLAEEGINATQTTISRDIRQLNLVKGPTGRGTYKYVLPDKKMKVATPIHNSSFSDAVISIEVALNIVVVKTHSGMANAIAVCIENMHILGVIGSVAGDDTIFIVVKTNELAQDVEIQLNKMFKTN